VEKLLVTGVTLKKDEAQVSMTDIPDKPGVAAEIFQTLAREKITVDIIVQSTGKGSINTISFTVPEKDLKQAELLMTSLLNSYGSGKISVNANIAIVSAVGVGMKSHVGVASSMFTALAENGINIEMISTSEIKISCVIEKDQGKKALNIIHDIFGLGK